MTATAEFEHEAFFYSDARSFTDGTANFVRAGLARDEPVLVVVNEAKIAQLRHALGPDDADRVQFADMATVGANPGRIIDAWRRFVDDHGRGTEPVRGIGEPISAERSTAELIECHAHESLLNVAFRDAHAFKLMCPYDTNALSATVIEEAAVNHPILVDAHGRRPSDDYRLAYERYKTEPLPEPSGNRAVIRFDIESLHAVRERVGQCARAAGSAQSRVDEIVLAVSEVATNSVRHGGGAGVAEIWTTDAGLVVDVRDHGRMRDPLAGRLRPPPAAEGGFGLWMANKLCDLVQIRTTATGTVVRLHVSR